MRFFLLGLPQSPDNLKGGVGLSRARGHDEQDTLLASGDGFDGAVDRDPLVVARLLAAAVRMVGLDNELLLGLGLDAFPLLIDRPEVVVGREFF